MRTKRGKQGPPAPPFKPILPTALIEVSSKSLTNARHVAGSEPASGGVFGNCILSRERSVAQCTRQKEDAAARKVPGADCCEADMLSLTTLYSRSAFAHSGAAMAAGS